MNVIQKNIYIHDLRPEYVIALPQVVGVSAIYTEDLASEKTQLVVAVYIPTGRRYGSSIDFSHEYEFIGVEIR